MRRLTITVTAALMLLAIGPAGAMARHHRRHHSRTHHARIEHFGSDVTGNQTGANSSDNAGTVQSFKNGVLTIQTSGGPVSGAVTRDTELECTAPGQTQTMHEDGDGGSGDQSGDGDQNAGEDQGDAAEQNENQAEEQNENQAEEQNENQAEDQNENQADDQNEDQAENNCSTSDLTPGTTVREADLRISGTGSAWKKVELGS
jgi:hypothetical protein